MRGYSTSAFMRLRDVFVHVIVDGVDVGGGRPLDISIVAVRAGVRAAQIRSFRSVMTGAVSRVPVVVR